MYLVGDNSGVAGIVGYKIGEGAAADMRIVAEPKKCAANFAHFGEGTFSSQKIDLQLSGVFFAAGQNRGCTVGQGVNLFAELPLSFCQFLFFFLKPFVVGRVTLRGIG